MLPDSQLIRIGVLKPFMLSGLFYDTVSDVGQHYYGADISIIVCCFPMLTVSDLTYIVLKPSAL